jgi:hypothetical protein
MAFVQANRAPTTDTPKKTSNLSTDMTRRILRAALPLAAGIYLISQAASNHNTERAQPYRAQERLEQILIEHRSATEALKRCGDRTIYPTRTIRESCAHEQMYRIVELNSAYERERKQQATPP